MTGYLPINEACAKAGITRTMLNRLIAEGKVRAKDTSLILQGRAQVRYVAYQDIIDVQTGLDLEYVDIQKAGPEYGIAPRAVRYQIRHHRIRWRRAGTRLQPCAPDLDMFVKDTERKSDGVDPRLPRGKRN